METEELTCESCNTVWTRQKTRGRKPKVCPNCVPILVTLEDQDDNEDLQDLLDIELPEEPPLAPTKYKPGTKWRCSSCQVSIKIGIGHDEPPTHACQKKLKRILPLEKV